CFSHGHRRDRPASGKEISANVAGESGQACIRSSELRRRDCREGIWSEVETCATEEGFGYASEPERDDFRA
ncbi:hypothetical protein VIGAN_03219200, partial [Vigna angularis var. angularis]